MSVADAYLDVHVYVEEYVAKNLRVSEIAQKHNVSVEAVRKKLIKVLGKEEYEKIKQERTQSTKKAELFLAGMKPAEIAKELGISRQEVCRTLKKKIGKEAYTQIKDSRKIKNAKKESYDPEYEWLVQRHKRIFPFCKRKDSFDPWFSFGNSGLENTLADPSATKEIKSAIKETLKKPYTYHPEKIEMIEEYVRYKKGSGGGRKSDSIKISLLQ